MAVSRQSWRGRQAWRNRVGGKNDEAGLRHGFRSGLEKLNAEHIERHGFPVLFETLRIKYTVPAAVRTYTPDFELPNGIIIETKGKFEPNDRAKHLFIKHQYPDLDVRMVFQRPHDPIYKGSRTTLAQWATNHGFPWATRIIPVAWLNEPGPARKPAEVLAAPPALDLSKEPGAP